MNKQPTVILQAAVSDNGEFCIAIDSSWSIDDPSNWGTALSDIVNTIAQSYDKNHSNKKARDLIIAELNRSLKEKWDASPPES